MFAATPRNDTILLITVALVTLFAPIILAPIGAGYPSLMQTLCIFGIFAVGFNLLFGLTGYLSFGHAAFLGVGSYAGMWMFKLLTMNVIPAIAAGIVVAGLFSLLVGFVSLRRSGIYFSILTLAFAQMSYSLAYSVLTPITGGETGLQPSINDPRVLDTALGGGADSPNLFGALVSATWEPAVLGMTLQINLGFYLCAVAFIFAFWLSIRIFRSPFGLMLRAIKTNQTRLNYTGVNPKPYMLAVFVISGMYAGLAGGLMAAVEPQVGADRMLWTESGAVVLMTILGGAGTLLGPVLGAGLMKYFEQVFSRVFKTDLAELFAFLPAPLHDWVVNFLALFTGGGWLLTLGVIFMLVVTFLPGGIVGGVQALIRWTRKPRNKAQGGTPALQPAE